MSPKNSLSWPFSTAVAGESNTVPTRRGGRRHGSSGSRKRRPHPGGNVGHRLKPEALRWGLSRGARKASVERLRGAGPESALAFF